MIGDITHTQLSSYSTEKCTIMFARKSPAHDVLLTQADVAAEHMQDALAALPFVPTAVTRAPLGHFRAAVAHIVGSHDGAWL